MLHSGISDAVVIAKHLNKEWSLRNVSLPYITLKISVSPLGADFFIILDTLSQFALSFHWVILMMLKTKVPKKEAERFHEIGHELHLSC